MAIKGVDISEMNGSVDFAALKKAGVEFVIIRCGYGSDYPGQQDTEFEANVRKAETAHMPYGVYHYSYAKNAAGGKAEAAHALRLIGNHKPAYGVWYDMEDSATIGGDLAAAADAFCSAVKAKGLRVGVYANLNWWENYLTSSIFDKYDRWCAQYNGSCDLKKPYAMWQYTSSLVISGKNFDGNWDYKIYEETKNKEEKKEMRYNKISEIPDWAQSTIKKLCDMKALNGNSKKKDENGYPADLNLSLDMIRTFVVNDQAGAYDR